MTLTPYRPVTTHYKDSLDDSVMRMERHLKTKLDELDKLWAQGAVHDLEGQHNILQRKHRFSYVRVSHTSACNLVVTRDSALGFEPYDWTRVIQSGAGQLTIVADTGVTINYPETLVFFKRYSPGLLIYLGDNKWDFDGDVELA